MILCTNKLKLVTLKARRLADGLTTKQKQWLWFVGLWVGGISSLYIVARCIRFLMSF